jgi:hypothetical protein
MEKLLQTAQCAITLVTQQCDASTIQKFYNGSHLRFVSPDGVSQHPVTVCTTTVVFSSHREAKLLGQMRANNPNTAIIQAQIAP